MIDSRFHEHRILIQVGDFIHSIIADTDYSYSKYFSDFKVLDAAEKCNKSAQDIPPIYGCCKIFNHHCIITQSFNLLLILSKITIILGQ